MLRLLLCALVLATPGIALAQLNVVPSESVLPPAPATAPTDAAATAPAGPDPSGYRSLVKGHKPSPAWTQDRAFSSTRMWLLDPGTYTVETWFHSRIYQNKPTEHYLQQEIEYGLFPHLQLDLYLNTNLNQQPEDNKTHLAYEGFQIEFRIAIPSYYGQIPTNPVIYLEYKGVHGGPGRVEARLLLGGQVLPWLFLAANPYYEVNIESQMVDATDAAGLPTKVSKFLDDAEVGTTLAAGIRINDYFRLSAEAKIGGDMLGDTNNKYHFVAWAGPGFILRPFHDNRLKFTGTMLFNIPLTDKEPTHEAPQQYEPWLIVGSTF